VHVLLPELQLLMTDAALNRASIVRLMWNPQYESMTLSANGWLHAVTLENVPSQPGYMSGDFEVTDVTGAPLFGSFHWEYAMNSAGMIFAEPLPNFNTATPYSVRRLPRTEDDGPVLPVIVSLIGAWSS
jgi:hypothetical protein